MGSDVSMVYPMESLCGLLFEVSNEDRLRILLQLEEGGINITNLSRELGISTQEASRHISRLSEVGLTTKDPEGVHRMTPFGELTMKQLQGFMFTSRHSGYFKDHSLESLPSEYVCRIGELAESRFVDDVMVVFHNVERMFQEAEEYIYRLTDRYFMMALPHLEEATERGVELRLLQSKGFEFPPDWPGEGVILRDARLKGIFKLRSSDTADVFVAMSEKEVAALAFPSADGRFDYMGFNSKDEKTHRWCLDLFRYYWDTARIPDFMNE
jgi:predicted transcriptional regulator